MAVPAAETAAHEHCSGRLDPLPDVAAECVVFHIAPGSGWGGELSASYNAGRRSPRWLASLSPRTSRAPLYSPYRVPAPTPAQSGAVLPLPDVERPSPAPPRPACEPPLELPREPRPASLLVQPAVVLAAAMHPAPVGSRSPGCCGRLRLNEDNSRFLLLGAALLLYLVAGAALFQWAERDNELRAQRTYRELYDEFRRNLTAGGSPSLADVERLLDAHLTADRLGLLHHRAQWDFSGSFHFSCTVVSTIGKGTGRGRRQTSVGQFVVLLV